MIRIFGLLMVSLLLFPVSYANNHNMHHDEHEHMMGEATMPMHEHVEEDLGICPVMGGHARKDYSYTHEGKTYHFCCPGCIEAFRKNPEKYISKIKEIDIEAYQFGFSPETIRVEKGDIVRLHATSRDVPHGIYIKEYDVNAALKKGVAKKIEFIADKTGEFDIVCSVYCGSGHHQMKAKLIVEE